VFRITRKPSLEVAPTTLATYLADREFSAGCYLFMILNSGLIFSDGVITVFFSLLSLFSQSTASIPEPIITWLWSWTMICDVYHRSSPRYCQDEPACQISWSKVILFEITAGTHNIQTANRLHACPTSLTHSSSTASYDQDYSETSFATWYDVRL